MELSGNGFNCCRYQMMIFAVCTDEFLWLGSLYIYTCAPWLSHAPMSKSIFTFFNPFLPQCLKVQTVMIRYLGLGSLFKNWSTMLYRSLLFLLLGLLSKCLVRIVNKEYYTDVIRIWYAATVIIKLCGGTASGDLLQSYNNGSITPRLRLSII